MPVGIFIDGKEVRITPTDEWGDLKENIALNKIEVKSSDSHSYIPIYIDEPRKYVQFFHRFKQKEGKFHHF